MNWAQNDGFISTASNDIKELNIIEQGCYRVVDINKKVTNAVLFDKVCFKYRLGYLYEIENGEYKYKFKCNSANQYSSCRYRPNIFHLWCKQKLEYGL